MKRPVAQRLYFVWYLPVVGILYIESVFDKEEMSDDGA